MRISDWSSDVCSSDLNYEYETYNGTAALEWKPNDDLKFYFDATLNNQTRGQQSHRVQISGTATPSVVDATANTAFETVGWGTLDGPDGPIDLGRVDAPLAGPIGTLGPTGTGIAPNTTH